MNQHPPMNTLRAKNPPLQSDTREGAVRLATRIVAAWRLVGVVVQPVVCVVARHGTVEIWGVQMPELVNGLYRPNHPASLAHPLRYGAAAA